MLDRLTDCARRVLARARVDQESTDDLHGGSEQLLLSLLHETDGGAASILDVLHVDRDRLRDEIRTAARIRDESGVRDWSARRVIDVAAAESLNLNMNYIGTDLLLIALLSDRGSVAAESLASHGVTVTNARDLLLQFTTADADRLCEEARGSAGGEKTVSTVAIHESIERLRNGLARYKAELVCLADYERASVARAIIDDLNRLERRIVKLLNP